MKKIDYALDYAQRGWYVLALQNNAKAPISHELQRNGCKDATVDENKIKMLWNLFPDANIGVATGKGSSLTVLDLDGMEAVEQLQEIQYEFPETYTVKTPRGWHHYYQYDSTIGQSAGKLTKCDIRNDGGYVVAAGSVVDGVEYTVARDFTVATSELPSVFKAGVEPPQKEWIDKLQNGAITEGQRNNTLFRYSCMLRANKNLNSSDIDVLVRKFNDERLVPPLPIKEVEGIILQALSYNQGESISFVGNLIEPPMIETQTDRRCTFYWTDYDVRVELSKINHKNTNTTCRMKIWYEGTMIFFNSYTLYSENARRVAHQNLNNLVPLIDWVGILQHITHVIDTSSERDGDIVDIVKHKRKEESPYLIYPVIRENQASIFYADGGSGKSTMALCLAASLATGESFIQGLNPTNTEPIKTLYLDWEADEDDVGDMIDEVARGRGIEIPNNLILYKHMSGAFIDRVDGLVDTIVENNVKLIIVDSLVGSAGSDVNDAEAARQYFQAVRSLKVASIGITHTNREGSLYGNRFFWNLSRQVYRIHSVVETESNPIVGMFHEKANRSQLNAPMAWEIEYGDLNSEDNFIRYKPVDIQTIPELAKFTGVREQIISVLKQGSMNAEQISEYLGISLQKTTSTLYQFKTNFRLGQDRIWELVDEV